MRNRAWRRASKENNFLKRMRKIYLSWGRHNNLVMHNFWPDREELFSNWKEFALAPRNYVWRKVRGDTWRTDRKYKMMDNKKEDLDEKRRAQKEIDDEINNISKKDII